MLLDERLLEYDIDSVIFEERSPFQKVQIVHSKSLGHMLVLDDLQSIVIYKVIMIKNINCLYLQIYLKQI